VTARQPQHAQPSVLAGLRWSSATQWISFALLVALGIGVLATVDAPAHPAAAAGAPVPPAIVTSADSSGQLGSDGPLAEQPPGAVSLEPISSTVISPPPAGLVNTQASLLAADGIPTTALQAYQQAADRERLLSPTCGLTWPLIAGIGRAESDHGRFAGAVLHTDGISTPRVIGIPLNGVGTALIPDTDGGRLDGDTVYDRAVGPMQFIPSTWAGYGVDANADGFADPFNIFDAAAATAKYLCSTGGDLTTLAGQMSAVRVYNDSDAYITEVLQLEAIYASGVPGLTVPVVPADPHPAPPQVIVPVANPGPPLGIPPKPKPKPTTKSSPTPSAPSSHSTTPSSPSTPPSSQPSTPTPTPCPTPTDTTSTSVTPSSSATSPSPTGTDCPTPTPTPSVSTSDTVTPTSPSVTTTSIAAPSTDLTSPGTPATSS
jgi:membrane-bound lytic murein transglycosylase B